MELVPSCQALRTEVREDPRGGERKQVGAGRSEGERECSMTSQRSQKREGLPTTPILLGTI